MLTTALKKNLQEGLRIAERVTAKSSSLPVLGNVLLSAAKNSIILSATDLEMGITYQFLATTDKEGAVVIPPKFLSPLIGLLPENQIVLRATTDQLLIEASGYRASLKTLSPEEFPIIPAIQETGSVVRVDTQVFCHGIQQVVGMAGQSQARPEIAGVFFQFQKETLKIVATDSFRLAEKTLVFRKSNIQEWSFILPQKTARELIAILGEKPGETKIYFSPSQAAFAFTPEDQLSEPQVRIVSRLIEGEYPHYQDIIPSQYKARAVVQTNEFLNHLKAASIFAGKTNEIQLAFRPSKKVIEIHAQRVDAGENTSFLEGEIEGEEITAVFNWRFLSEGIFQMRSKELEFRITSEDGPALLRPLGDEQYLYVVMPVKA